mgnify:CR=1 FL=1
MGGGNDPQIDTNMDFRTDLEPRLVNSEKSVRIITG